MSTFMSEPPAAPDRPKKAGSQGIRMRRKRRKSPAEGKKTAAALVGQIASGPDGRPGPPRVANPIVPPRTVARRTLLTLVAIMSFLACLAIAAVSIVAEQAQNWQRQIADEVTIQVKPEDGTDL